MSSSQGSEQVGAGPAIPTFGSPTDDKQPLLHALMGVFFAVATIALVLRLVTRKLLTAAGWWWDDYLVMVAWMFDLGFFISTILIIEAGLGRHVNLADPNVMANTTQFLKLYIPAAVCQLTSTSFSKLSILAFLWRIFSANPRIRMPIIVLTCAAIGWNIAIGLVAIFNCQPIDYWWDRTIAGGHCVDNNAFLFGNSVPNTVIDFAILILPLPFIWKLHQSLGRRIALTGIFLLGGFVCIVSIIRMIVQVQRNLTGPDLSWEVSDFVMWTIIETNLAIISACLPSLWPTVKFIKERTQSYFSKPSSTGSSTLHGYSVRKLPRKQPKMYSNRIDSEPGMTELSREVDEYPLVETTINGSQGQSTQNGIEVSRGFMVDVAKHEK